MKCSRCQQNLSNTHKFESKNKLIHLCDDCAISCLAHLLCDCPQMLDNIRTVIEYVKKK